MNVKLTRVLLIEDNPGDVRLIQEMLKEVGRGQYNLDYADRLSTGLEHMAKQNPDIILLDLGLPDSQGLDTLARVCAPAAGIPVVVLTGLDDETVGLDAIRHGAQDYLVKGHILGKSEALQRVINFALERKKLHKALEKSEQNLRNSLDNSPLGIRIVNVDGEEVYANDAILDIYGYASIEELKATPIKKLYTPESYAEHQMRKEKRQRGDYVASNYEVSIVRKDSEIRHLEVFRKEVLWNAHTQYLVLYNDITERQRAVEDLKISKAQLEEAQRVAHIGHWELSNITGTPKWSQEIFNIFGINPARGEPSFAAHRDLLYPDDWDILNNAISTASSEGGTFDIEFRILRPDKSLRWIRFLGRAKKHHEDVTVTIFGTAQDITQYKQMMESLKVSEIKYRTFFEHQPLGLTISDKAGNIRESNREAERLLGLSKEIQTQRQIDGHEWQIVRTDGSPMPADEYASVRALKENRVIENVEMGIVKGEGVITWLNVTAVPIPLSEYGVVITYSDITERKQLEKASRQLEVKAQINSRLAAVGEMAAGIAHEINNPLTGVLGFSKLLLERKNVPEEIKEELSIIADGSQRVAEIVRRLLTFARQTKPMRTSTSMNELINNTLKLREYVLKTANIEVVTRFDQELSWSAVDPGQLQQVFMNLIVNAEQAMKAAHGKGTLTVTTEKRGNNIRITFQDDGPGIPKENMAHLFEPFFTTKGPGEGTGLGLSLSHSIILEHGGEMIVESEPGHGATFIIDLPIVDVLPFESDVPATKAKGKPAAMKKGRILVVDDEPGIRGLIKKTLTQTGHSVDTTGDPKEALDKLAGATYDVLFLDVRMPGMSGIELYALIQEKAPAMANRIIFITGDTMGADVKAFLVQNNLAYLSKPFDLEGLKEKVDIILGADQPENDSPDRSGR